MPLRAAKWGTIVLLCMPRFIPITSVYATVSSGSLSILATGVDSVFDIGSNILLFYIHQKSAKLDHNKWPVGGSRLETIGDIVYGMYSHPASVSVLTLLTSGSLCVFPVIFRIEQQ